MWNNQTPHPNFSRSTNLIKKYYENNDFDRINEIFVELFSVNKTLNQRRYTYRKYKGRIDTLQNIFKKIVIEKNKAVQKVGYNNYLDYMIDVFGIPIDAYHFFEGNIKKIIQNIFSNFPDFIISDIKWTRYNIPYPDANLNYLKAKSTYKKLIRSVSELFPILKRNVDRIIVDESKEHLFSSCIYYKNGGDITIETCNLDGLIGMFVFVHELGHAIDFLECEEKKINPFSLSHYYREERAIIIEREFAEKYIQEKPRKELETNILKIISSTLFESEIYRNTNRDFSGLYARAVNQCYYPSHQRKNPFYVLDKRLVLKPLTSVLSSVIYSKYILQK